MNPINVVGGGMQKNTHTDCKKDGDCASNDLVNIGTIYVTTEAIYSIELKSMFLTAI